MAKKKAAAKSNATATATATKGRTKSELFAHLCEDTGLTRKQVGQFFDSLNNAIKRDLSARGPGMFTVPGLMKITVMKKPAVKAHTRPDPFNPGQMMQVKAKPARKVVKVRPLKNLKDMV